jgi:altronate hydrolase
LYEKKRSWIDFNACTIVEDEPIKQVNERFIGYIISVASDELENNEKKNYTEI